MYVAMNFEMESPSLPPSRPINRSRRSLIVIISCAAIMCVLIIILYFRLEARAGEEPAHRLPVTELPVKEPLVTLPPLPTATGIFAATTTGLIVINLQTLEATSITSQHTTAVAVNHNMGKVYWSEAYSQSSSIMCSNFNGSDREIIVPQRAQGHIYMLAVHEPSGNIYFSIWDSNKITVCNALGLNCSVVISRSSLANKPWSMVVDSEKDVMYWSNYYSGQNSLNRAKLDGSSIVTIIFSGFSTSASNTIALVQSSNNTLYWADYSENTIGTIDVNSSNKRTLLQLQGNPGPDGIQIDAHKIYFGNWYGKTIQSVDRDSGKELTTIFNSTGGIRHLALFSTTA